MLTTGWDQNAFNVVMSPGVAMVEDVVGAWLTDPLGLPAHASFGFVTGGQGANTVSLSGSASPLTGLFGSPRVRVIANGEGHAMIDMALRVLGFGTGMLKPVVMDSQGAIDTEDLVHVLDSASLGRTIVSTGRQRQNRCLR